MRKPKINQNYRIESLPASLKQGGWGKLLDCWAAMIKRYTRVVSGEQTDAPYWYGERAITGLLAAAAWKLPNGWSLEEFSGLRRGGLKKTSGSGDLWLGTGMVTGDYTIEAKIVWPRGTWKRAVQQAKKQLKEAAKQLRSLDWDYVNGSCVGICYIVPELLERGTQASLENINKFFEEVPKKLAAKSQRVVAVCRYNHPPKHKQRIYPGIILAGELVSYPKRKAGRAKYA